MASNKEITRAMAEIYIKHATKLLKCALSAAKECFTLPRVHHGEGRQNSHSGLNPCACCAYCDCSYCAYSTLLAVLTVLTARTALTLLTMLAVRTMLTVLAVRADCDYCAVGCRSYH